MTGPEQDIIGLIPANGHGRRLAMLPGSKELLPVAPAWPSASGAQPGLTRLPEPACVWLLNALASAGVARALMVIRSEKWDIPTYLGEGDRYGIRLAYVVASPTPGPAHSLDRAFPFVADRTVVMGFPDILFSPRGAVRTLIERFRASRAALMLGLFPAVPGQRADRIELAEKAVAAVRTRPERLDDRPSWCLAAWGPEFTRFLHRHLDPERGATGGGPERAAVGDAIQAALEEGLHVEGAMLSAEPFLDIGTPAGLSTAWRRALLR